MFAVIEGQARAAQLLIDAGKVASAMQVLTCAAGADLPACLACTAGADQNFQNQHCKSAVFFKRHTAFAC